MAETSYQDFNLDQYIRKVPNFPKEGILFYDITSVLCRPEAFQYCIRAMADRYQGRNIDAVAAIEARGFLFAAPFAERMGIPLVLVRKKGKLPGETRSIKYQLEYGQAEVEIHSADIKPGMKVLLTDDLVATGGTLRAARELITGGGAVVPEIFGVIGLPFLGYEKVLLPTPVHTLIQYHGE
ncbi:MAG: adenine phosphoribosyltransferase [Spirochaetaceae bacterium]|jgi:adenine phosphoribosyltransferase|nr:adenine phosphoribosyltransferase [Spirochaetaceae bacterium]